jgi:hypothetical protein
LMLLAEAAVREGRVQTKLTRGWLAEAKHCGKPSAVCPRKRQGSKHPGSAAWPTPRPQRPRRVVVGPHISQDVGWLPTRLLPPERRWGLARWSHASYRFTSRSRGLAPKAAD